MSQTGQDSAPSILDARRQKEEKGDTKRISSSTNAANALDAKSQNIRLPQKKIPSHREKLRAQGAGTPLQPEKKGVYVPEDRHAILGAMNNP